MTALDVEKMVEKDVLIDSQKNINDLRISFLINKLTYKIKMNECVDCCKHNLLNAIEIIADNKKRQMYQKNIYQKYF